MKTFVLLCVLSMLGGELAWADDQAQPNAVYALIVGANRSVDADLKPLRYADDDAVRYQELFRASVPEPCCSRPWMKKPAGCHRRPLRGPASTHAFLSKAVAQFAAEIATARARGENHVLLSLRRARQHRRRSGYVTLEDARLDAASLGHEVLDVIKADENHLIVDAAIPTSSWGAWSWGRAPPDARFLRSSDLGRRSNLGLLLSTSSGAESHEWGAYQAGIFSHEVRSGLYGAAISMVTDGSAT